MAFRAPALVRTGLIVLLAGEIVVAREAAQRRGLDAVVSAYVAGDTDVVSRTFKRSADFLEMRLNDPGSLSKWLGPFDRGKAVVLIDIARASATLAPNYTSQLVNAGRRYFEVKGAEAAGATEEFAALWHQTAVAVMERVGNPIFIDAYLDALERTRGDGAGPRVTRLPLSRGIAQDMRCWELKPLDQAGEAVEALTHMVDMTSRDLDGPRKARVRAVAEQRKTCLRGAVGLFDAAARIDETRDEARVRGAWILFQEGRHQDALTLIQTVTPGNDPEVGYWAGLFRGRVLDALGRPADAVPFYRAALKLFPAAQSAGVGLTMALFRSGQEVEADRIARDIRVTAAAATDPWSTYLGGDQRFVERWIGVLRSSLR